LFSEPLNGLAVCQGGFPNHCFRTAQIHAALLVTVAAKKSIQVRLGCDDADLFLGAGRSFGPFIWLGCLERIELIAFDAQIGGAAGLFFEHDPQRLLTVPFGGPFFNGPNEIFGQYVIDDFGE
jgi:hypothetical protein